MTTRVRAAGSWWSAFILGALLALSPASAQSLPPAARRFAFVPQAAGTGYTHVPPDTKYSDGTGFGFEQPSVFSVAVPEGNYRVTVTLGDARAAGDTTIYAELRRLMLEHVVTVPGAHQLRTFIVNVRRPQIRGGGAVRLKERETTTEARAWDDRLTLEFAGSHPAVSAVVVEPVTLPTVYLLGDSTMCDQPLEPYNSWGQMITRFLKPDVAVANHAESGESLAGALAAGRLDKIWSEIKKGDYLFVQFGHNDMKSTDADALHTYTANMKRVVDEARRRGAVPVLVTSVSRRTFDAQGRKITDSFNGYTKAVREVARETAVPLIDLQTSSATFYEALGPEASHLAFATMQEGTHHNNYGSYEIAKCGLNGIRDARLDLAKHIVDEFKTFDPARPDPIDTFKSSAGR
jgi:lysophospholipase L1-like esterase